MVVRVVSELVFIAWLPEELDGESFLFKLKRNTQNVYRLFRVQKVNFIESWHVLNAAG